MPSDRTTNHQRDAADASDKAVSQVESLLRQADTQNMTRWFAANKSLILEQIEQAYQTNQSLAWLYLHSIAEEAGTTTEVFYRPFVGTWVWRSLGYLGWRQFEKDIGNGIPSNAALELMIDRMKGGVFRHSYNGSRDAIIQTVQRSKTMIGYQRVSRTGMPCSFCAMLIGRGAVYKTNMGRFQAHDTDQCTAEPRFWNQRNKGLDPQAKRFQEIWKESTKGKSGASAINAFRVAYERGRN
jgi:hypothetical protein